MSIFMFYRYPFKKQIIDISKPFIECQITEKWINGKEKKYERVAINSHIRDFLIYYQQIVSNDERAWYFRMIYIESWFVFRDDFL